MRGRWGIAALGLLAAAGMLALVLRGSAPREGDEWAPDGLTAEQLRALGYADWSEETGASGGGVTRHDPGRAWPGYTLFASRPRSRAELVDMEGRTVHAWSNREVADGWSHVELLPSGDLLVVAKGFYLARLDWDSRLLWRRDMNAHHDVDAAADGMLYTLRRGPRRIERPVQEVGILEESIVRLSPDGEELARLDLWELFGDRVSSARLEAARSRGRWTHDVPARDVFHANSIERLDRDIAGMPTRGDLLICLRELDLVAIVDFDARRVEWAWGPGELDRPHHPTLVDGDRILIFDNGKSRGHSRVIEVDPRDGTVVWSYEADPPGDFFSSNQGASQRLPNGNTLITESKKGRALEVTRNGDIVWEYLNPDVEDGRRGAVYRFARIPPEVVSARVGAAGD